MRRPLQREGPPRCLRSHRILLLPEVWFSRLPTRWPSEGVLGSVGSGSEAPFVGTTDGGGGGVAGEAVAADGGVVDDFGAVAAAQFALL